MNKFRVEIVGDDQHPEGGHVVIRLLGLDHPPKRPEFTIEPADTNSDLSKNDAWPKGELKPVGIRQIGQTVEFLVGPDIVENVLLQPGTPVVIGLPSGGQRCDALWPSVPPLRQGNEETVRPSPPATPSRAETKRLLAETKELLSLPERPQRNGLDASANAITKAGIAVADVAKNIGPHNLSPAAETNKEAAKPSQPTLISPTLLDKKTDKPDPADSLDPHVADAGANDNLNAKQGKQKEEETPLPEDFEWEHKPDLDRLIAATSASEAPTPAKPPVPTKPYVAHPPAEIVTLEKYDEVRRTSERASRRFAALALFIALLASATSVYAVVAREGMLLSALVSRLAFGPSGAVDKSDGRGAPAATLYGTLVASPLSPQGQKASGIDTKAALQRADHELHPGGAPADKREAAFWLKHYLVGTIGDARTLWALTQLGTIYADPSAKSHDYHKARMLWELSASMGDPIALCFLGNLHEFGYGVRADPRTALTWYQRAKQAGGCNSLDRSIARVRQ